MFKWIPKLLWALLLLASVNLLSSCAEKGNSVTPAGLDPRQDPPIATPTATPTAGPTIPKVQGTSDSGGGTGVDGKVFESYIVDPIQLPAYKQILDGLFKNVQPKAEVKKEGTEVSLFKMKTWYIAPVDLEKLEKDVLGVSFIASETQQIARQTMKEVWIDKRIFDKMSIKEQAELILHEYVMSLYFIKFMTFGEICSLSNGAVAEGGSDNCAKSVELGDQVWPPEKAHPLNDKDNENIRFATGWLLQNLKNPISESAIGKILYSNGFDKRFFRPRSFESDELRKSKLNEMVISSKEFFDSVRGADLSGNMPDTCAGLSTGLSSPCRVEIENKEILYNGNKIPGRNLKIKIGEKEINISEPTGQTVTLSASENDIDGISYSKPFVGFQNQVKVGDRFYIAFLFFKNDRSSSQTGLVLESIIVKPGIVTSIDKKSEKSICKVQALKATSLEEDGFVIKKSGSKMTPLEVIYSKVPPYALCTPENAVD